jgi:transposase
VGQHRSASVTRLLGLDGFKVVAVQVTDGEWQLSVQTVATVVGCQGCGVRAELHGRRMVRVRDLPIGGRPVVLLWRKRIWRCGGPACGVRTWTERAAAIRPRAVLTERARAEACRRVGKDAHSVAAVARDLGLAGRRRCGRWRIMAGRWWRTLIAWMAWPRLAWTRRTFFGPPARRPPGGSPGWSTWSVAGRWTWCPTAPGPR